MRYQVQGISRAAAALAVAGLFAASAQAATVEFSFGSVIQTSTSMSGTAPWMDLKISDTASPGTLLFDLNSFNLVPNQRLTGLFLNLPTAITAGLTGVSISAVTATNPANATPNNSPIAFVGNPPNLGSNSAWSSAQNLTGATAQNGGSFDFYIKFPTNATAVSAGAGTNPLGETFQLTFAGSSLPTATSFLTTSYPQNGNLSKPSYYAVAAFTNSDGINGNAWISATPVPEPESLAMLLAGLAVVGAAGRRRKTAAQA
jgi:hypothetical protein